MPRPHGPAARRAAAAEMWGWRGAQPRVPVGWARQRWDRPRLLPAPEQPRTWRDTEVKVLASDGLSSAELISREPGAAQLSSQRSSVLLCTGWAQARVQLQVLLSSPRSSPPVGRGSGALGKSPDAAKSLCQILCLSLPEKGTVLKYCAG